MSDIINIKNTAISSQNSKIKIATIEKRSEIKSKLGRKKKKNHKNKIFISWSGTESKTIARALRDWLPHFFQSISLWMSETDIKPGTRWANELAHQLNDTDIGIICLTQHNLNAPWILFEAGALSKSVKEGKIIPYLYGLQPHIIKGPLSQFQCVKADKDGTLSLVKTILKSFSNDEQSDAQINNIFYKLWPEFYSKIKMLN